MSEICSMCGKKFEVDLEDECFLAGVLPICITCADKIDIVICSRNSEEFNSARTYISEICKRTANETVKNELTKILDTYYESPKEKEEKELIDYFYDASSFSAASGKDLPYVVYQVTLKEKFIGTGSKNLEELEEILNHFYKKGYRLHTMSTATSHSTGLGASERIQATLVFEKCGLFD